MYYGKLGKKTSMHLVTISVRLCMSEYTGNTLALCPMQTQLFLKSSCPFISYFNRYRPCQIRERQHEVKSCSGWGQMITSFTVNTKQKSTHPHSHVPIQDLISGGNDKLHFHNNKNTLYKTIKDRYMSF